MFPSFSKLAVVVAVILVLWYALRWAQPRADELDAPPAPACAAKADRAGGD